VITSTLEPSAIPNVFGGFFRAGTWAAWRVFLAALFGLPMTDDQLATYRRLTGRTTPPVIFSNFKHGDHS
jgi:hypothetical protein